MRFLIGVTAILGLTACATKIPDSAAGIPDGDAFGAPQTYAQQDAAREAALQGAPVSPTSTIAADGSKDGVVTGNGAPLNATGTQVISAPAGAFGTSASDDIARQTAAALAQTAQGGSQPVLQQGAVSAPQTVSTTQGISNENNFDAVGNVRSIDADAQLIAQNRAQYQVVQPTALPSRTGGGEPNVVQYALSTTHPVGTTVHSRAGINKDARAARACAKYGSPDLAQADFLAKGGPSRDRLGLDPDGDGYACAWDPSPFRAAIGG